MHDICVVVLADPMVFSVGVMAVSPMFPSSTGHVGMGHALGWGDCRDNPPPYPETLSPDSTPYIGTT